MALIHAETLHRDPGLDPVAHAGHSLTSAGLTSQHPEEQEPLAC